MELKWLEDMVALMEEGSFSKAAERRNVTQPAFSRRIQSFENWLGCEVVDRTTQPVTILKSAWSLEPEIRALSLRMQELKGRFRSSSRGLTCLDFACQHTLAVSVFPEIMQLIRGLEHSYSFRLRSGNLEDCITACLRGDADFLLSYEADGLHIDLPDTLFSRLTWGRDRLLPVVGGELKYKIGQDSYLGGVVPVLGYPDSSFLGQAIAASILPSLLDNNDIEWRCEAAFTSSIREMCLVGMGLAWLPYSLIWKDIKAGRLIELTSQFDCCELEVAIRGRRASSVTADIMESLKNTRTDNDKLRMILT